MWCFHDRLKQFTFSEEAGGETVKMCPDCTSFDAHRIRVLKTGHVDKPDTETQQRWDIILDQEGLGVNNGTYDWLMFESDLRQPNTKRTPLDDHFWLARQQSFRHTHSMPRLFTNYCPNCEAYLPIKHECDFTLTALETL